ncbi:MAG: General secretion pathway protein M [Syntrophorhabdus sp. PtaU1.Bin153]|nr:MAG: General secretion pathway protein M [Syntrophorhabdus sp. PtaU1.Bin153]
MAKKSNILAIAIPLILVLLGFVAYDYGYLRLQAEMNSMREMERLKTRTLSQYVTLIAEKPQFENKLASIKEKRKADQLKLIEGKTLSLAAATLQENVKAIITGRGGTVSSERVEKPEDLGSFKVITIAIDSVLPDMRALTEILYTIETRTPSLYVNELDTRVRNLREPRELMVKLKISALTTRE